MNKAPLCLHSFYSSATGSVHTSIKWGLLFGVFISYLFLFHPISNITAKDIDVNRVISGSVCDDQGIVDGAVVRIQATVYSTTTGPDGKFRLEVPKHLKPPVRLTAWAKGYYIGGPVDATPGEVGIKIHLKRHSRLDNHEYKWLPSTQSKGQGENQGCAECHYRGEKGSGPMLPVDEWLKDAHSQSAKNPIFLTMHSGKDVFGNINQSTRYRYNDDNLLSNKQVSIATFIWYSWPHILQKQIQFIESSE
ncbi:MAG: carboxypeptidase regulatory-like domain-containing protein [Deltaproteobacteria bacterium]|nr:carboxypeptidase regulatory-like domain-containing protein [Deltaproteobacteria bacterium]